MNAHNTYTVSFGGHEDHVRFSFIESLRAYGRKIFKVLGIINDAQINAHAFSRLEAELFRLSWVEGIATRGFALPSDYHNYRKESHVYVLTSEMPNVEMHKDVEEIVVEVNRRFGTNLKVACVRARIFALKSLC